MSKYGKTNAALNLGAIAFFTWAGYFGAHGFGWWAFPAVTCIAIGAICQTRLTSRAYTLGRIDRNFGVDRGGPFA